MKYLVLLKNNLDDFRIFWIVFYSNNYLTVIFLKMHKRNSVADNWWNFYRWYTNICSFQWTKQYKIFFQKKLIFNNNFLNNWKFACSTHATEIKFNTHVLSTLSFEFVKKKLYLTSRVWKPNSKRLLKTKNDPHAQNQICQLFDISSQKFYWTYFKVSSSWSIFF